MEFWPELIGEITFTQMLVIMNRFSRCKTTDLPVKVLTCTIFARIVVIFYTTLSNKYIRLNVGVTSQCPSAVD
ncbi:hypothetical protein D3C73_1468460 [compost metagenome]